MRVTNITAVPQLLQFGKYESHTIQPSAYADIADSGEAYKYAIRWRDAGLISINGNDGPATLIASRTIPATAILNLLDVTGSTDQGAHGTITLAGVVLELTADTTLTAPTNVPVTLVTSAAVTIANLKAAINANTSLAALGIVATDIMTVSSTDQRLTVIIPATVDATVGGFLAAAGGASQVLAVLQAVSNTDAREVIIRTVTATGSTVIFPTGFSAIYECLFQVRTSAGVIKLAVPTVTITGGTISLIGGGTAIANTDLVTLFVLGH